MKQDSDHDLKLLNKVINGILTSAGLSIGLYAIILFIKSPDAILTMINLKELILPILLTTSFIPFLYFLSIYSTYESSFVRVFFALGKNSKLVRYAKWKLLIECLFNLKKLSQLERKLTLRKIRTKKEFSLFLAETH